jgi:hypothetical protein
VHYVRDNADALALYDAMAGSHNSQYVGVYRMDPSPALVLLLLAPGIFE